MNTSVSNLAVDTGKIENVTSIANEIFQFSQEHDVLLTPGRYGTLFEYCRKTDRDLCRTIDTALRTGGDIATALDALGDAHSDSTADNEKVVKENGELISATTEKLIRLVNSGIERSDAQTEQFTHIRDEIARDPGANQGPQMLEKIIADIVEQNNYMREETMKLRMDLEDSNRKIVDLVEDLNNACQREMTDFLTKLGNRAYLEERMEEEARRAKITGDHLSFVICDLDHFKGINDTFGHLVGDEILKIFAKLLDACIKGRDVACRYGGEEFVLILPQTDTAGACALAEEVRRQLEAKKLMAGNSGRPIGKITASFGVASLAPEMSCAEVLKLADEKLYEAKNSGRNRVVS